jgi:hypothetical protein
VILAAAAVAVVAGTVVAQSGAAGGQTITFKELNKGSRFDFVDNAPKSKPHAAPVFSIGDQVVFVNPITDDKGAAGELRATCTFTKKAKGNDAGFANAHPYCSGAYILRDGTLFAVTSDAGGQVTHGAIVGGTGAYVGAHGTFSSTTTKAGDDDVVTLDG